MERIKRYAPDLGEKEMRQMLIDISDEFCESTLILEGEWNFVTTPGQMYYPIDDRCVGINEVNVNDQLSDKLVPVGNVLLKN
jgi:hypothetical protein